jgi:hypothetical protein
MISVRESLISLLSDHANAAECIAWCEKEEYPLDMRFTPEVSAEKAQAMKEDWEEACDNLDPSIPTYSPLVGNITVGKLHEYLTKILESKPCLADAKVMQVEFGNLSIVRKIEAGVTGIIITS